MKIDRRAGRRGHITSLTGISRSRKAFSRLRSRRNKPTRPGTSRRRAKAEAGPVRRQRRAAAERRNKARKSLKNGCNCGAAGLPPSRRNCEGLRQPRGRSVKMGKGDGMLGGLISAWQRWRDKGPRYETAPDAVVRLMHHRPEWASLFRREDETIRCALGDIPCFADHVGSSSVAKFVAKPDRPPPSGPLGLLVH